MQPVALEQTTARNALAMTPAADEAGTSAEPDYTQEWAEYHRKKAEIEQQWRDYKAAQHAAQRDLAPAAYPAPFARGAGTNSMAIAGFVLVWFCILPGIVCAHVALSQIRRTGEGGGGLAIATLVLGYLSVVVVLAVFAFLKSATV